MSGSMNMLQGFMRTGENLEYWVHRTQRHGLLNLYQHEKYWRALIEIKMKNKNVEATVSGRGETPHEAIQEALKKLGEDEVEAA